MDHTGEQLHPNWRALATLHIPLKRFVKEGTRGTQHGTHTGTKEKYEIHGVDGSEVKAFYEELLCEETRQRKEHVCNTISESKISEREEVKPLVRRTPFEVGKYHRFAMENNVEELQNLDYRNQNINVCDNYGWSALMMAACEGHEQAVRFLISLGVDKNLKDKSGQTAMDMARRKGHFHIEKILENPPEEIVTSSEDEIDDIEPFYCEICKRTFAETTKREHETSTVHQFNVKAPTTSNKLQKFNIPPRNKGLQLMVKQGWDKESGLGPTQTGRLYPVKTVIRKQRTGLGIEQDPAKVSHFQAYDLRAIKRHNSDYYKKKPRNRNDIKREKIREWKRDRRLRNELN
ncbi:G patch domain and ankyrin repeat-containing protein 1 homolog [Musca domestica]|uniref:G patch domain and ankyrin repeat-containing protein 1 homolog n=1 Tax=Musca domestica TaxID=7370 RepID=A0A1I8MKL9_MUSDO|nr:G patch domain and ankyrin repeat-containing protein 1 homolog [Musca domestica]